MQAATHTHPCFIHNMSPSLTHTAQSLLEAQWEMAHQTKTFPVRRSHDRNWGQAGRQSCVPFPTLLSPLLFLPSWMTEEPQILHWKRVTVPPNSWQWTNFASIQATYASQCQEGSILDKETTWRLLETPFWTVLCIALLLKREHVYHHTEVLYKTSWPRRCCSLWQANSRSESKTSLHGNNKEQTEGTWGNLQQKPVDLLEYLSDESAWFWMSCIYWDECVSVLVISLELSPDNVPVVRVWKTTNFLQECAGISPS